MSSSAIKNNDVIQPFAKREIHFEEPVCHINAELDSMGRHKTHPQPLTGCHGVGQFYNSINQPIVLRHGIKYKTCTCACKKI
ncbi:hypothetical protein LCDV1gp053 [Lymphocystis disease virus 1]|uniref:hypothetical protein n=1 Tax=Fish lymphocystis disease virus TaxID=36363 RepID=UPI0000161EFF|nr:hypothetical protein LCDV1gp053 [Lymphocystis disease virus 1]